MGDTNGLAIRRFPRPAGIISAPSPRQRWWVESLPEDAVVIYSLRDRREASRVQEPIHYPVLTIPFDSGSTRRLLTTFHAPPRYASS